MSIATCIGCGCDDLHACDDISGACYWLVVDYVAGKGVCSCCKDHLARWKNGDRSSVMLIAKITRLGESKPYFIERNAIELFPHQFDVKAGDKFTVEWVTMTTEEFEALPQFEHIHLTKTWANEISAISQAKATGDCAAVKHHRNHARRLERRIARLGFDVHDLLDALQD